MSKLLTSYPGRSALAVLGLTIVLTLILGTLDKCGGYASWAQGVGTALAAVVALWAVLAGEHQKKEEKKRSIMVIAEAINSYCENLKEELGSKDPRQGLARMYDNSILREFSGALERVPVHEIGRPEAVTAFLLLHNRIPFLEKQIEGYLLSRSKCPHTEWECELQGLPGEEINRRISQRIETWEKQYLDNALELVNTTQSHFNALKAALNA